MNFRKERRSNETHESKTDPDARLARKGPGKESKLSYSGNLLIENRNGLILHAEVFVPNGTAERDAALIMLEKLAGTKPLTWLKTIAVLRKLRHRGVCRVDWLFAFACAAYNLVRMRNLIASPAV